jgi:methylmalonyl-CoA mutase
LALEAITLCAKTGKGNLLELAIVAARERATLEETTEAMAKIFGRYKANIRTIQGIYAKEMNNNELYLKAKQLANDFAKIEGRRPRILVAKLGQDGHDRGSKVISTGFADIGFDVDIGPLFQTPAEAAQQAVDNDVHILGISSLAAGHKTLIPVLINELEKLGSSDIMVVVGGVIPPDDHKFLFDKGVKGIFGTGTPIAKAAIEILEKLIAINS